MVDTKQLIEAITRAIFYQFKKVEALKGPSPGLTISILPSGEFYASIIKYDGSIDSKQVVAKATGSTLEDVLQSVSSQFLISILVEKNPLDDLNELVHPDNPDDFRDYHY